MPETSTAPTFPEVIDLTASPQKPAFRLDNQLRFAIITASQENLCDAVLVLCEKLPEVSKIISSLLLSSPPLPPSTKIEVMKVPEEKVSKKRKRKTCENCGLDPNDDDGCCKYMVMQRAAIQEAKDFLRFDAEDGGEGPNVCDNCGGDPDEGDGCCKWAMMQESKRYEARLFLSTCDSSADESESD